MARRIWLSVSIGVGLFFSLIALLVVGTFSAASGMVTSGRQVALAQGTVPAEYQPIIQKWGNLCSALNPALLAAQLYQESGWNPRAQSGAEAQGIAQFIPGTWATHGLDANGDGRADVWDPQDAIPSAASYDCQLAAYVRNVPGDNTDNMLASYNAGAYAVIKYRGVPPFRETQHYVAIIRSLARSFAAPVGVVGPSQQAAAAISFAQSRLGTPYLWGGEGRPDQQGRFDCSGLSQASYATAGIHLPRVANDQWNAGPHPARSQLLPGDLVFFATDLHDPRTIHHVGMYVGGGYMIDAPHTGAVIRFDPIDQPDYIGATRVTRDGAAALPTTGSGSGA